MASSESESCKECGQKSLTDEEGTLVCMDCGAVNTSQQVLVSRNDACDLTYVNTEMNASTKRKYSREPDGLHLGRLKTTEICEKFKLSSSMQENATRNFVKVYAKYRHCSSSTKMAFAAACAYLEARSNNFHVLAADVIRCLEYDEEKIKFHSCLARAKAVLGIEALHVTSSSDLVVTSLKNTSIPEELYKKIEDLVTVIGDVWRHLSYPVTVLLFPCAYITWLSSSFCHDSKTTYFQFCFKYSCPPANNNGKNLCGRFISVLINLAKNIPWIDSKKITRKNVLVFLPDIISNQSTLMSKAYNVLPIPIGKSGWCLKGMTEEEVIAMEFKIKQENPRLNETELGSDEFKDELSEFIRTPKEVEQYSLQIANVAKKVKVEKSK